MYSNKSIIIELEIETKRQNKKKQVAWRWTVAMLGLKGFLNQCKTCNLMKKTEKVWPTCTKEFVRKLFQPTFPMAFLFHLTVSFIWRVRHVWHWLNGRWLCVCVSCWLVLLFFASTLSSCTFFVVATVQLTEQSNHVKEWKCQKVEGQLLDNSQFYVI